MWKTSTGKFAGTGGETEQAVGRLIGSLCAVTARDEDAQSAMLASWISQVSFLYPTPSPPSTLTPSLRQWSMAESVFIASTTSACFCVG